MLTMVQQKKMVTIKDIDHTKEIVVRLKFCQNERLIKNYKIAFKETFESQARTVFLKTLVVGSKKK